MGGKVWKELTLGGRRLDLEFRVKDLSVIGNSLDCFAVIGNNLLARHKVSFDPDAKTIPLR